jgi:CRISPR-associated endoribonuclease Cas6
MPTPPKPSQSEASKSRRSRWAKNVELVGVALVLKPERTVALSAQSTTRLHAWFLDQVRQVDPQLSATLHDASTEKAFTLSELQGKYLSRNGQHYLEAGTFYQWRITALSGQVAQWLADWLKNLPVAIVLQDMTLMIQGAEITDLPTTYKRLWNNADLVLQARSKGYKNYDLNNVSFKLQPLSFQLSFLSPTSFRRKSHHFPLPLPFNVFHSYLRRWNIFAQIEFDADLFLAWIDESVLIQRHRLESMQVLAGKSGAVTGFTGAVEYTISPKASPDREYEQLFFALAQLAIYCGTGHKTTFGLGQTHLGWLTAPDAPVASRQSLLIDRIAELTALFLSQRKRTGGDRSANIAETWATILARREMGESLLAIAADLEMPYQTVKTYAKLARQGVKDVEG